MGFPTQRFSTSVLDYSNVQHILTRTNDARFGLAASPWMVWLDAKPSTKITCNGTQPRIAGMRCHDLGRCKESTLVNFGQRSFSIETYLGIRYTSPGRNMFSHQVVSSL
jgi:hypothetical protein